MNMSSTSQDTGITEAQAAERLFARYQSEEDHGAEGETQGHEPEPEAEEVDPEGEEPAELPDDPDADPEEPEGEPEASQTFKVKVHGEEVEVPLDELLKGYSREQDYTRKAQAVAEARKEAEAEKARVAEARSQYEARLETVAQIIEQSQPRVDQSLRQTNPAEWSAQMHQQRLWAEQRQVVEAERERLKAESEREEQERFNAFVREQQEKLPELIPEWRDAKVAEAEVPKLRSYGVQQGYEEQEIDQLADARAVRLLRKAMLYDELMAKKPEVQTRLQQVKTMQPGPKASPSRQAEEKRARDRLATTGGIDAAVSLILAKSRRA